MIHILRGAPDFRSFRHGEARHKKRTDWKEPARKMRPMISIPVNCYAKVSGPASIVQGLLKTTISQSDKAFQLPDRSA
ncbi:MAG: hypothetical protein C4530_12715 [Desulfobacteraceae bacterium]|nr:MAG: hypothetical protein C4530_12715 [Desulfobacteraceae bacterium]